MHFDARHVKDTSPALKLGLGCVYIYNTTARVYDPSIHAHIIMRSVVNDTCSPLLLDYCKSESLKRSALAMVEIS